MDCLSEAKLLQYSKEACGHPGDYLLQSIKVGTVRAWCGSLHSICIAQVSLESEMLASFIISLSAIAVIAFGFPVPDSFNEAPVVDVTIFTPPADYNIPRTLYARTLLLKESNKILATWENYSPQPPLVYYPIFESDDLGQTWHEIGQVHDQVNGWGMRYQPFLYELPESIGGFPAGALLCAGNSIPANLSNTQIDLYASLDKGYVEVRCMFALPRLMKYSRTWNFVSHIASGGEAIPDNGLTPVWEPFLMMYNGYMICYYSDQRDWPAHGQKLDHQISYDLRNWAPPVNDVAYSNNTFRPGMTTVAHLPNGKYMMTYEFYGAPEIAFAVYYRQADDPTKFNEAEGQVLRASNTGNVPAGSPYIVWTPVGGPNGTIVVSSGCCSTAFINRGLAEEGSEWIEVNTTAPASYTRSELVMPDQDLVLLTGGGVLGGTDNRVTASTLNVG